MKRGNILIYSLFAIAVAIFCLTGCSKTSVETSVQYGTVSDFEGNTYKTVAIGSQTWMAENLRSIKLNDGTAIRVVTDNNTWSNLSTPAYAYYSNDSVNNKYAYGALYNWYTVHTNKLCPAGWHVPTDAEWTALNTFLGVDTLAGGKLKTTGSFIWYSPNTYATNSTGFNALPGGYRFYNGSFNNSGISGNWWTASENSSSSAWYNYLTFNKGNLYRNNIDKLYGLSVRCIKD